MTPSCFNTDELFLRLEEQLLDGEEASELGDASDDLDSECQEKVVHIIISL